MLSKNIQEYRTKLETFTNLDDYGEPSRMCQRNIKKVEREVKEKELKKYILTLHESRLHY